jgi:antitoxin component of RelBE/YafQ-DinJ toxin-antitoxin module
MAARAKDTQITVRIDSDLLQQAKQRCDEEDVTISLVIRAALQDYVRYGMEVRIRRSPPDEEDPARFF